MRPLIDEYFIEMAKLVATRSTCLRRHVGCVLVDVDNHVMATGYNGVPSGFDHCNAGSECPGAHAASGTQLDGCFAVHAEQNALLQCKDTMRIKAAYVTATPCISCMKMLLNTSCQTIWSLEAYPHNDAVKLWEKAGRELKLIS